MSCSAGRWSVLILASAVAGAAAVGCRRDDSGSTSPGGAATPAQPAADAKAAAAAIDGKTVYAEHCAVCHMADGRGVPNMQPSLVGSPYLAGDEQRLVNVIRGGSAVLAADRPNPVANDMPPFGYLSPEEIDALVRYLNSEFVR